MWLEHFVYSVKFFFVLSSPSISIYIYIFFFFFDFTLSFGIYVCRMSLYDVILSKLLNIFAYHLTTFMI